LGFELVSKELFENSWLTAELVLAGGRMGGWKDGGKSCFNGLLSLFRKVQHPTFFKI
jgi:hypothetical protein